MFESMTHAVFVQIEHEHKPRKDSSTVEPARPTCTIRRDCLPCKGGRLLQRHIGLRLRRSWELPTTKDEPLTRVRLRNVKTHD